MEHHDRRFGRRWVLSRLAAVGALGSLGRVSSRAVAAQSDGVGELATVSANQHQPDEWHTLQFDGSYEDPVVVMGPLSEHGGQPAHARLRHVSGDRVEWKIEEWDYLGGYHHAESVSYLVMEGGERSVDGATIRSGTVTTDDGWKAVAFDSAFDTTPVVLTHPQTYNGGDPIVTRTRDVSEDGFSVRVKEEQAKGGHTREDLGYIAVEPGTTDAFEAGVLATDDGWESLSASSSYDSPSFVASTQTTYGRDPVGLRHRGLDASSVDVRVEEERSASDETGHTTERVGYLFGRSGAIRSTDGDESGDGDSNSGPVFGADFAQHTGEDPSEDYEEWLGRTVLVADEFMKKESHYHDVPGWKIDPWTAWVGENDDRRMCWDLMLKNLASLEAGANGGANEAIRSFGETLVAEGHDDAYLRISAEFNLGHTINPDSEQECTWFTEFWRRVVDTLRSVEGQDFAFVWNPTYSITWRPEYARDCWPGDEYVDLVGIDIYDRNWDGAYDGGAQPSHDDHVTAWKRSEAHLDWFKSWADDHGKELCIPEWGVWEHQGGSHGGGDNPYFVRKMYDWMHENDVVFHVYFEELEKHGLYGPDTQFPEASATFEQLFG